jgi:type III polyketide synthase
MDILFRTTGVAMAVQACTKAIDDWEGGIEGITHTVAVTCTNQGNPGFDLLVNERLGLSSSVDRTLLHGIGCTGGLAIMRTAAQIACGSTMRGRPARILCYACEITTSNVRYELDAAAKCVDTSQVCIAGALFSDAAAAFVLCNDLGLQTHVKPVYELLDWETALIPETKDELAYYAEADGTMFRRMRDLQPPYADKTQVIVPCLAELFPNTLLLRVIKCSRNCFPRFEGKLPPTI